jgi:hypothetical protein
MDPLTTLYERLRRRGDSSLPECVEQPPLLEDWLRYWNDSASDLANLHNFEHWLTRARPMPEHRQP